MNKYEVELLARLGRITDAFANELDEHHDDFALAAAIDVSDSGVVAFRRAVDSLRFHGGWLSERTIFLEERLAQVYGQHFEGDPPPVPDDDGQPLTKMIWDARRQVEREAQVKRGR